MNTKISNSLSNSLSSIQLNLFDCGLEDAKERVVKRALNQSLTHNMNDKLSNLDDNHFEYVNPVCPHCIEENMRGHIIKKGFRARKIRINGEEKINPYANHDEEAVIKQTIHNLNVSTINNTLTDFNENIELKHIHEFVNTVRNYNIQDDKNVTVYLRKYHCKKCNHYFQTELKHVYSRYKRYAKSFFDKIDEIISYSNYIPSQLQEILSSSFNREINLKTIYDWTRTEAKLLRSTDYNGITYIPEKNLILNQKGIGSGVYNYDEQYISENRKDGLRLTLSDPQLEFPLENK